MMEVNRYLTCRLRHLQMKHPQAMARPGHPPLLPFISQLRGSGPVQKLQQADICSNRLLPIALKRTNCRALQLTLMHVRAALHPGTTVYIDVARVWSDLHAQATCHSVQA